MTETYILALDQGSSSSRALLFDRAGRAVHQVNQPFPQHYPQPGWVEHDPTDLWTSQLATARRVLQQARVRPEQIAALGVANQRETTLLWDRTSGAAIYPAIVWQCRRTAPLVEALRAQGWETEIRQRTGLTLDAYFSGTKIRWLLDHVPGAQVRAQQGKLAFGTVDTWLLYHLSAGRLHCTDYSNASRTMLYNIHTRQWDAEILRALDIPAALLPEVRDSSGNFGTTTAGLFEDTEIPIGGVIGDQQGALFGQACFTPGAVKNTYGTGSFVLMNSGSQPPRLSPGLLSTIAWGIAGQLTYALEGSIFATGSTIQWLRDTLQILHSSAESATLAMSVPDTNGVYFVPAFTGLGSPYWDMYARGLLIGLSRGTTRAHIVRAALEAMAYQTCDVLNSMQTAATFPVPSIRVDGGAAVNNFAMQFQSDILQLPVQRPQTLETTALGAAYLAGLAVGYWENLEHIAAHWRLEHTYTPQRSSEWRDQTYARWQEAVRRSRGWTAPAAETIG